MTYYSTSTYAGNDGDPFSFSLDTNGGVNTFAFDGGEFIINGSDIMGSERFDDIDTFLARAVEVFDGTLLEDAEYNDYHIANGNEPNRIRTTDDGEVIVAGRNVDGKNVYAFDTVAEAENFEAFVRQFFQEVGDNAALAVNPTEFKIETSGPTGNGLTVLRFDDSVDEFVIKGNGVPIEQRATSLEDYVDLIASIYGGTKEHDADFDAQGVADGALPNVFIVQDDQVRIQGASTVVWAKYDFDDVATAEHVEAIYEELFAAVDNADAVAWGDMVV